MGLAIEVLHRDRTSNDGLRAACVLALLQVGGHPVKEEQSLIDAVRAVKGEHHFVTYMSLTCQNCPRRGRAPKEIAFLLCNTYEKNP